jgi:uncharacterized membrane protein (UPF0127 family)
MKPSGTLHDLRLLVCARMIAKIPASGTALRLTITAVLLLMVAACSGGQSAAQAKRLSIVVRGHVLEVEIVADDVSRARGLMFREEMADNGGMLFVYPADEPMGFWMRNTPLPLSIAFLDGRGRIINIADMEPFDERMHFSEGEARYALEVHQGWFARRRIGPGDQCEFTLPAGLIVY